MGVTVSNVGMGIIGEVGTGPVLQVWRSRADTCMHEFHNLGDPSDSGDWEDFTDVLAAAKTSVGAFVSAMTSAYPTAASDITNNWTTAEQTQLYGVAVLWAAKLGL